MNTDVIKDKFKFKVAISKMKEENNNIAMSQKRNFVSKKIVTVACACLILTTGIVFAKDIENFIKEQFENFGLGKGVTTAIENGYISDSESSLLEQNVKIVKNNEIIDTTNLKCNIEKFIMTDNNLSLEIYFEFEKKIKDYIDLGNTINGNVDYEGSYIIELSDLFIIDENNETLYFNKYDNQAYNVYCVNNHIECNSSEVPIFNYSMNYKKIYNDTDSIGVNSIYNFTTSSVFPNSKQLNIYFRKIRLYTEKDDVNEIILEGNWNFKLDVPKVMYDRTSEYYKVISCDNNNFNLYEAKATDTGFEIGLKISNIEKPEYPKELLEREKEILENSNIEMEKIYRQ